MKNRFGFVLLAGICLSIGICGWIVAKIGRVRGHVNNLSPSVVLEVGMTALAQYSLAHDGQLPESCVSPADALQCAGFKGPWLERVSYLNQGMKWSSLDGRLVLLALSVTNCEKRQRQAYAALADGSIVQLSSDSVAVGERIATNVGTTIRRLPLDAFGVR